MKNISDIIRITAILASVLVSTAATAASTTRERFANDLLLPTYLQLAQEAAKLETAVIALADAPTAAKLQSAREAWVAARQPWETSEAFLFGPVDTEGHDPLLDSWPVNLTDVTGIMKTKAALAPERLEALGEGFTGFHVVEYFLFADANGDPLSSDASVAYLTSNPIALQYLLASAQQLRSQSDKLLADYDPADGAFISEIIGAGSETSIYPNVEAITEEIALAMIGIVEEVRIAKLLEPVEANDPALLESRFSGNTLTDIQDNIGGVSKAFELAIAPALSDQSRSAIQSAIGDLEASLAAIDPVRLHANPASAKDSVATAASRAATLQALLESEILANVSILSAVL